VITEYYFFDCFTFRAKTTINSFIIFAADFKEIIVYDLPAERNLILVGQRFKDNSKRI